MTEAVLRQRLGCLLEDMEGAQMPEAVLAYLRAAQRVFDRVKAPRETSAFADWYDKEVAPTV